MDCPNMGEGSPSYPRQMFCGIVVGIIKTMISEMEWTEKEVVLLFDQESLWCDKRELGTA
jgi:hypothetical protein